MTRDLEERVSDLEREVTELKRMIRTVSHKAKELDSRTMGFVVIGGAHID